jgi:hypothetical protein
MKSKIFIWFVFVALLVAGVQSMEVCKDEIQSGESCEIITGVTVNASNVSIILTERICNISVFNSSGTAISDNVEMSNGTYGEGRHNFTFSQTAEGIYTYNILCSKNSDYGRESGSVVVNQSTQELIRTFHGTGNYNTTGTSPSEIWTYSTRNLTYYNQSLTFSYLEDINASVEEINTTTSNLSKQTAWEVWNYSSGEEGMNMLQIIVEIFKIIIGGLF